MYNTLVLLHTPVGGVGSVGKQVRLLALDGRNAELAGGSARILVGDSRGCSLRETSTDSGSCQQEEENLSSYELKSSWRRLLGESARDEVE